MIIKNGNILNVDRFIPGGDLCITGKKISAIDQELKAETGKKILEADGCYVLPGLIDIHTHGLLDLLVDECSFLDFSRLQLEHGVTGCLATLGGGCKKNLDTIKRAFQETEYLKKTPNILGFRPEILYLADASAGNPDSITEITSETSEALCAAAKGYIRIWDISPELEGAIPFIRWANEKGIITSMAHSNASILQVGKAVDAGMSLVTHFYDLFPMPEEVDEGVYPAGVTDYINIEDRLTVEMIPDGVHVHPFLLKKTLRCKGLQGVIFITDSVPGAGKAPGFYDGIYEGIKVEVTKDRGVRRVSDDILSGSALTHIQGFRNAVEKFGLSIPEASRLCSRNQAELLGLRNKGYLAPGMDADIIILDKGLKLVYVIAGGEIGYRV